MARIKITLALLAAIVAQHAMAQQQPPEETTDIDRTYAAMANTVGWKKEGVAAFSLSQSDFRYWAGGGTPSAAFDAGLTYSLNHRTARTRWANRLELAYGINRLQGSKARKTNDKIYFASNYGYLIAPKLYASALLTFGSQFTKGYDYRYSSTDYNSRWMAPGYLSAGVGLTWLPRPWLSLTFSPATWRGTFVTDKSIVGQESYGVKPGHILYNEFGASFKAEANVALWKTVSLYSRLSLFSNYLHNPQNVDVRWDTQIRAMLTRVLTASLNVNMLYDDDIGFVHPNGHITRSYLQIREVAGLGLAFRF